ncbi:TnsD family Tn7-like transposition protein [Pseudomonas fluorescens]|uniref:TnsD family Tn7-like transposition protein n=1 Tax=Pseudomonas fluorescens TaxID=294 RepID=UPI000CD12505|nr:TnsD family Tn7-like transposition protein [Pseudomonas fluorescens]PNY74869.1 transposase [Pseudomonas fluorescens]
MKLKFHFFPTAFPDETLHSVLSRYARLCGVSSCKAAFAGERAAAWFTQNVAFPSRLRDLVELLPRGTDLSVAQIIKRHTTLPYYTPFLTINQLQYAQASMAGEGKGLMLKLGINASRIEGASRVRFCTECINEDISRVGVAYWHRVHQLPGVLVCPHHRQLLRVVDPSWYSRNTRQLNLPTDDGVQAHSIQLDAAMGTFSGLHQIALSSLQLLDLELDPFAATSVRSYLLQGAANLGLTSGLTHRLDLSQLAAYMASFFKTFPAAWEYLVLRESPTESPAAWVTKLLRKPRSTHHPLKYIVLASALKVDLARIPGTENPTVIKGDRPTLSNARASETALAESEIEGLEGFSAEVWKLALSGHEAAQIAGILDVSQVYVYRTIRAVNGGPAAWRNARFLSESRRRRANFEDDYMHRQAQQCRGYAWLYRCDRAWLSDRIKKNGYVHASRVDSSGRFAVLDADLAKQVRCCAQRLRALPGKPVRISRTRVGRELHVLSRFEKQLSKLPLCRKALDGACESSEQFRVRRLLWAEVKLMEEQKSLSRSALYRAACIRPDR